MQNIWPQNKIFGVFLSHDVDQVKKTFLHSCYYFIKTGKFFHLAFNRKTENDPYWNFKEILRIEKKYGVKSTFFFLNETVRPKLFQPLTWLLSYGRYRFSNPEIQKIIKKIDHDGWEIGLHGSYYSYLDKDLLRKEKKALEDILGKPVTGVRQHYLNLQTFLTWESQKEIGFDYDSSFGSNDSVGFIKNKFLPFEKRGLLVIPINIMDSALFDDGIDLEKAWQKCLAMINMTERRKCLLSIVWHNRTFSEKDFPGYKDIYIRIIKECKRRNAWFGQGREIYSLFKGRNAN